MNKNELINAMAETLNSKKEAQAALQSLLGAISKGLKEGGKVTLTGFGTFTKNRRKARTGRNPQTGETIKIKAGNVVKFKPGKKLKEAV
jgi:DNA-binding protein HU-beta